ncbi:hypothetical protein ACJJTC_001989 [Scirpophaga incertulas]
MDAGNDHLDTVKLLNVKGNFENITPHKIAVVAFIREYGLLKIEEKQKVDCVIAPKYRKDFCILALKLIQCPDMEFKELETLLTDGRYNLLSVHLQNFCVRLQNVYVNGISALMDCVTSTVDKLMIEQNETHPCVIARFSVLGFYLRRILIHLDKLTFMQVVTLYKSFCLYYQKGRPGLMMRSLSKEKLNHMEPQIASTSTLPVQTDEAKQNELSMRMNIIDKDNYFEECQWSRKQAELFTAQQANLLQINERKALAPRQLQKIIIQINNDIPEYPDIHFLSFLNCIRMKEFCGAQDSLYNCFDQTLFSGPGNTNCIERNKNFRYAALNRAAMHTQFGHKVVAMEAVKEALGAAQEAADGACLAQAAAWGAVAGGRTRRAALLGRPPPAAPAAHLVGQHAAANGARPADVFQLITKVDTSNYIHSMTDLTMASLANQAALWSMYGKTEMASVCCQLLLNLNTSKWEEAEQCIRQLASFDRWESQLLKAEMYFLKGDSTEALESLHDILDFCKNEDASLHFMSLRLKAMILMAQVQHCFSNMQCTNIMLLNEALSLAKKYHLHYLAATAEMHIANVQLHMGCAKNALLLVRKVLPIIMAHGSTYDMARGLLLYVKCRIASAPVCGESRTQVLQSCCEALDVVKKNYAKVGAHVRLLQTWYLQAQLYNDMGNHAARNQCAWMFRQLEIQNHIEPSNMLLIMY